MFQPVLPFCYCIEPVGSTRKTMNQSKMQYHIHFPVSAFTNWYLVNLAPDASLICQCVNIPQNEATSIVIMPRSRHLLWVRQPQQNFSFGARDQVVSRVVRHNTRRSLGWQLRHRVKNGLSFSLMHVPYQKTILSSIPADDISSIRTESRVGLRVRSCS